MLGYKVFWGYYKISPQPGQSEGTSWLATRHVSSLAPTCGGRSSVAPSALKRNPSRDECAKHSKANAHNQMRTSARGKKKRTNIFQNRLAGQRSLSEIKKAKNISSNTRRSGRRQQSSTYLRKKWQELAIISPSIVGLSIRQLGTSIKRQWDLVSSDSSRLITTANVQRHISSNLQYFPANHP